MLIRADSARVACPLFQAEDGGSKPTSALQLRIVKIAFSKAKELNRLWHSRFPKFTSPQCRASFVAEFDGIYYAVAIWGRPIAGNRMKESQYETMELRRFAIAHDAPKNTASRLLAIMTRIIRDEFPQIKKLISYQDMEVHTGIIYKACGWTAAVQTAFKEWNRPNNKASQSKARKQRWEKIIRDSNGEAERADQGK